MVIFLNVVGTTLSLKAQQDPQFSQYMFQRNIYNPAYLGISPKKIEVSGLSRQQYLGFNGAPFSNFLTVHAPIGLSRFTIGARYMSDVFQPVTTQTLYGSGNYKIPLNSIKSELSFGAELGMYWRFIDYSNIKTVQTNDQALGNGQSSGNNVLLDAGLGTYFRRGDFYLGVSAKHLIPSRFDNYKATDPAHLYRTFYAMGGTSIKLGRTISVKPSFLFRATESFVSQADLSLLFSYADFITLGCSYRTNNTLIPILNVQIFKGVYISYSYDYNFGDITNLNSPSLSTNELMIRYIGTTLPPKQRIVDPRYSY